jgi:hypothetical protein
MKYLRLKNVMRAEKTDKRHAPTLASLCHNMTSGAIFALRAGSR